MVQWIKLILGLLLILSFVYWIGPAIRKLIDNEIYQTIESRDIDAGALFYTEEELIIGAGKEIRIKLKD